MKKKSKKIYFNRTLATTVLVSSAIVLPTIVSASTFSDVKSTDYFSEYVAELVERDILHGYPDGTFRPYQPITRGEAVKIITKLLDLDTTKINNSIFKDVSENHIFYKEITALANAELISGYGDGTFLPEKPILRYEMAILLSNVFELTSKNKDPLPFKDIDPKYQHVVSVLYENQITSGTSATTFGGSQFVTRGQFAKFILLAEKASNRDDSITDDPITDDSNTNAPITDNRNDTPYTPPTALVISGIKDGEYYNQDVKILVNVGVSTLKKDSEPEIRISNGHTIKDDGEYVFTNTYLGNKTTIRFVLDKTAPIISGVSEGEYYKIPVIPDFNEGEATLSKDGGPFDAFVSGTEIPEDGHYQLKVVDKAGNVTTVEFTIDQIAPIISDVVEGEIRNSEFVPTFNEGTGRISKDDGEFEEFISGTTISDEGHYKLDIEDQAGNKSTVQFTIDKTAPIITEVEEGKHYQSVAPAFTEGIGRISKDGGEFESFTSGTPVVDEGQYTLEVTDEVGNQKTVQFTIDKTAPIITEVEDGTYYQSVAPQFNEGTAILTKDGEPGTDFISGTEITENGQYTLEVTDEAGNKKSVQFTVDNLAPEIGGVRDGEIRNSQFIPTFNEGTGRISKNGGEFESFTSGTPVVEEGEYTLEVTDEAGNKKTVHFVIDKTAPIITEVTEGKHYQSVAPVFNEGTAILTKDGETVTDFVSGTSLTEDGQYTLEVTDEVGHKATVTFTIDNVPPEITGKQIDSIFKLDQTYTDKELTILFNEGTAKLSKDMGSFVVIPNNHLVIEDGVYVLEVTDLAGNQTVANFVIDSTPPMIDGVENGMSYRSAIPIFIETTAKLSLNGGEEKDFVSGTEIVEEGEYVLRVIDQLNRETIVGFNIDQTAPMLVSASLTTPTGIDPTKAGISDVVTLLVTANEVVTISDVIGEIGGKPISNVVVDNLGDNDPTTYEINIIISEQGSVNGAVSLEFKMTDAAGNSIIIDTEDLSGIGTVDADTERPRMQSSSVMADDYVDLQFSESVYGGDKNALGPLEAADFNAILNKVGGNYNPLTVTVTQVTAIDGSPLVGGETEVRVFLNYNGAKVQGDKIEIRPVTEAILDDVGNAMSSSETSELKSLTPLITYEWIDSSTEDILFITSSDLNMSTYTNIKLILAGDGRGEAEVFLTTPTPIGGDDQILISVSPGWDNAGAYFGSTANGVFAQAVDRNKIEFTANTQYNPDYRQDHFYVILQDINNPSILTIIDLNIDSHRENTIILNSN